MHGLFVFTYHAQHPSLCKTWLRQLHGRWMREIFADGRDWRRVIAWPRDRGQRQQAVDRAKVGTGRAPEPPSPGQPIDGEMTVADLSAPGSPDYPSVYPQKVESWAKSVAEHRFL